MREAVHHAKVRRANGCHVNDLPPDQFNPGVLAEDSGLRHPVVFRHREAVRPYNRHHAVHRPPSVIGNAGISRPVRRPQPPPRHRAWRDAASCTVGRAPARPPGGAVGCRDTARKR